MLQHSPCSNFKQYLKNWKLFYSLLSSKLDSAVLAAQLTHFHVLKITSHLHLHAITPYWLFSSTLERIYDTTWRYHIRKQQSFHGIRGKMSVFMKSFLSNRIFQIQFSFSTWPSFPQFWRCHTLFFLAVNGLVSVLPPGIWSSLYASAPSIPVSVN